MRAKNIPLQMLALGLVVAVGWLVASCGAAVPSAPAVQLPELPAAAPATSAVPTPSLPAVGLTAVPSPAATGRPTAASPIGGTASIDQGATQDGRPLVARVNGQPICREVYEKQVTQTEQALAAQGISLEGEQGQAQRVQIRENVLRSLIEQALIEQAAVQMQITVSDQELEQSLQATTNQGQLSVDQWLAQNNMTMDELRAMQRAQLLANKIIQLVSAWVPTNAEQIHARQILCADEAKAHRVLGRLQAGENFAALAQQESEDQSTAPNGGDLGWFPRDIPLMPPAVVEAAFGLKPGDISGVVHSEMGYHILKVEAREAIRPLAPDMLLYMRQRAFEQWLAEQSAKADIKRYPTE
jgi:peptidyl-prolyl cis-trans isomerase C